jgi:hypothetical protein
MESLKNCEIMMAVFTEISKVKLLATAPYKDLLSESEYKQSTFNFDDVITL